MSGGVGGERQDNPASPIPIAAPEYAIQVIEVDDEAYSKK